MSYFNKGVNEKDGFAALFLVLATGAVVAGFALWSATGYLWSIRGTMDQKYSIRAKAMANACIESALESMRENHFFSGSGSLTIDADSCQYTVTSLGGNGRTVVSQSTVNGVVWRITVITNSFDPIVIASWVEQD